MRRNDPPSPKRPMISECETAPFGQRSSTSHRSVTGMFPAVGGSVRIEPAIRHIASLRLTRRGFTMFARLWFLALAALTAPGVASAAEQAPAPKSIMTADAIAAIIDRHLAADWQA